jgi:hypothetical protein
VAERTGVCVGGGGGAFGRSVRVTGEWEVSQACLHTSKCGVSGVLWVQTHGRHARAFTNTLTHTHKHTHTHTHNSLSLAHTHTHTTHINIQRERASDTHTHTY